MSAAWFRPGLFLVLCLLSSTVWAAPPIPISVTSCEQILRGPASYYLAAPLACARDRGLTLESASLDLRGFTITCTLFWPCVRLQGKGAALRGGTIQGFMHEALALEGQGAHRIDDLVAQGLDLTILITSNANRLTRVTTTSGYHGAVSVQGNDNRLSQVVAGCRGLEAGSCINVRGHGNRLDGLDVTVTETWWRRGDLHQGAVELIGNDNEVRLSTLRNADRPALIVDGRDNHLLANRLTGIPDAVDRSGGCVANDWKRNLLLTATATPPCLLPLPGTHPDADTEAIN